MGLLHIAINYRIKTSEDSTFLLKHVMNKHLQDEREISAIIVTNDYLCYKEPKSPYNFFLVLIFNKLFTFKTSDEWQHSKTGSSTLEWKEIKLVYAVTQIPSLSLQYCHDFQTRKLACKAISFYVNYIEHVIF